MTTLIAYSAHKMMDLTAVTARDAIRQFLGFEALQTLTRFQRWVITGDVPSDQLQSETKTLFSDSFYFINANKESFSFSAPSQNQPDAHLFYLKITPKTPKFSTSQIDQINQSSGTHLSSVTVGPMWEMATPKDTPYDEMKAALRDRVILTTARTKGLLVNPLSETFELSQTP